MRKQGRLVLADGMIVSGTCLYEGDDHVVGELVFSTSTTGYTEIVTDPSFYGQIVVLAYPEVGNYGVNLNDFQSKGITIKGLVVRNLSSCTSSFRSHMTLSDLLLRERIPILYGVDTRALITRLRDYGSSMAVIAAGTDARVEDLVQIAHNAEPLEKQRLSVAVSVASCEHVALTSYDLLDHPVPVATPPRFHVVAMDFGVKHALIKYLQDSGARVTLVRSDIAPEEIWAHRPDGLFLSNGPGDPKLETRAVQTVRSLLGKLPMFGVCMGHQIIAQALGNETFKLQFGHRGSNQAVRRSDGSIITTAQNHGFAVKMEAGSVMHLHDRNISDGTNEGINVPSLYVFSVQFHPEGAPGPLDGLNYFAQFIEYMEAFKQGCPVPKASKESGHGGRIAS